jgi:hypothetical protein
MVLMSSDGWRPRLFGGSAPLTNQWHGTINRKGSYVPKMPTFVVTGLWSAITVAAFSVVAMEQSQSASSVDTTTTPVIALANPTTTAAIVLTDAAGNRYRTRRD